MKNLFSYCIMDCHERDLQQMNTTLAEFLEMYKLDGIEQLIYGSEPLAKDYRLLTAGVHLAYWPYWLDFWQDNKAFIKRQFKNEADKEMYFHGAGNKEEWLSVIKRNIATALEQKPEYLVWHIAECSIENAYTFDFGYKDREVVMAAAEVFNLVAEAIPLDVTVLFENLWWPGLRLLDKDIVEDFFELIDRENTGVMLDTGHLLNTNDNLKDQQQGTQYICEVISALGSQAHRIKGIHLSCSLSGDYQRSFLRQVPEDIDMKSLINHIVNIDQHRPFTEKCVQEVLAKVRPDYVVHELNYRDFSELAVMLPRQLKACGLL